MKTIELYEDLSERMLLTTDQKFTVVSNLHVFYSLRAFHHKELSHSDMLNMKYHYKMCEKYIRAMNGKMYETADYYFKKLESISQNFFPGIVDVGMKCMINAAIAHRHYRFEQFQIAVDYVNIAIEQCYTQTLTYTPDFLISLGDLVFNEIRIYARWKKRDKVIEKSIALLSLVLFGKHERAEIQQAYRIADEKGKMVMLNMVFNMIFKTIDQMCKKMVIDRHEVFRKIFNEVFTANDAKDALYQPVYTSLKALHHYYQNDYSEFLNTLDENLGQFEILPDGLRNFLTELFVSLNQDEAIRITDNSYLNSQKLYNMLDYKY